MRHIILCAILLSLARPALALYGGSSYSLERWVEDYSYLKDPSARSDPFDAIKYMPLNDAGDWYLSFGGQARYRFDYFNNSGFGAGPQDETGFDLVRLLAHVDAHFGPNFRAFIQLNSGLVFDRVGGPRAGDADDIDLQQAFVDVSLPLDLSTSLTLRLGRQELVYGAQRLISPNDWGNVRRTFEGAKLSLAFANDTLEAFLVRPILIDKKALNGEDAHTTFAGIYNVSSWPELWPRAHAKLDTYLLLLDRNASRVTDVGVNSDTFTLGIRPHANPAPWDFDVEADWQFGRVDGRSICAYSLATETAYTLADWKFTPRVALGFDLASGSPNPAHRFNQLFPPLYLYFGHMYLFGRENIIDLHPGITLNLTPDLTLAVEEHLFWRQNTHDAVYNIAGGVVRPADNSSSRSIGNEFDIVANWQIQRHVSAYLGWAHFFTGSFIDQTGAHSDQDFFYTAVTFTF
jgi:hypothetical protein